MEPLTVTGSLEALAEIRKYVRQAASSVGLDQDATYRLVLAADELATNAVTHGYQEHSRSGDLTIRVQVSPDELVVAIEDTAPEYDPRSHRPPTPEDLCKPLMVRDAGGLGVFLALRGLDRFDYERSAGRNRCLLIMKRPSDS